MFALLVLNLKVMVGV